jgi:hypothetical protein
LLARENYGVRRDARTAIESFIGLAFEVRKEEPRALLFAAC